MSDKPDTELQEEWLDIYSRHAAITKRVVELGIENSHLRDENTQLRADKPLTAEGPCGVEGIAGAIGHQGPPDSYFVERLYGPAAPRVLELEKELRAAEADLGRTRRENTELRDLFRWAASWSNLWDLELADDEARAKRTHINRLLYPR